VANFIHLSGCRLNPASIVLRSFLNREETAKQDDAFREKELIINAIRHAAEGARYILLLTKNNAALSIIQQDSILPTNYLILYGSSFPDDQASFSHVTLNWFMSLSILTQ